MNTSVQKKYWFFESREQRMGFIFFLVMLYFHVGALFVFQVGFSWTALAIFFLSYVMKAMGITTGFHRYFAHRSFKTSRWFQFILAVVGTTAVQGGVLWWSSHHRGHHAHSDQDEDLHSPVSYSTFQSHLGWMWSASCFKPTKHKLLDFARFPEIKWLNKNYSLLIVIQGALFFLLGELLSNYFPSLGTSGAQVFVWGFLLATVWTWHVTFSINSVCHLFGKKRYKSADESRNNWLFGILAFGEGWHNNHHKFGWSARNGFYWYEWDPTYYLLKTLEKLGIVWDLKIPSKEQMKSELV